MQMVVVYILLAILVFGVIILIHELGHFLTARACGVGVNEFAIGMGPTVVSKEKDGTKFAIRALPIGGLCMFHGEDEGVKDPECFSAQPVWKRMIVVAAGPVMNILVAIVLAVVILMTYGEYMQYLKEKRQELEEKRK